MANKTENKNSVKNKVKNSGRKSSNFTELAIELSAHGFTGEQIEDYCGMERGSIERFLKKSPEFKLAYKNAEAERVLMVEKALLKRAAGYETIEKHIVCIPGSNNETNESCLNDDSNQGMKIKEIKYVKKFIPADSSSALLYLYNRRPDRWSRNPNQAGNTETLEEILEKRKRAYQEATENL